MPAIITIDEVKTLLQIADTETTKITTAESLIPIIQDTVIEHCDNTFETVGVSLKNRRAISFTNKDSSDATDAYITDNSFTFEEFEAYLTANSTIASTIAIATTSTITDTGAGFDGKFAKGDIIQLIDTASSDGIYTVKSVTTTGGTDTITIDETATLTTESAGTEITITKGVDIRITGSKYNDGLKNFVTFVSNSKLTMRSDLRLVTESINSLVSIDIITGITFPIGIKLPVANLIGYHLSKKDKGISAEKIGDYSVTYSTAGEKEIMKAFKPWCKKRIRIFATSGMADKDYSNIDLLDTNFPEVNYYR